ncbi:MAG: ChrB protein, partial [Alphaproteobacteria bacterium]|nr:ChrB protein [Alphaproteobacteria bacterium]
MSQERNAFWILLIHQLPPRPAYLRVKVWRRLQALGAVAIKNTVYALPESSEAIEDLQWLRREIAGAGGEAVVCEARFLDGLNDDEAIALFHAARDADYAPLIEAAEALARRKRPDAARLRRLLKRQAEIRAIDYFGAPAGARLAALLAEIAARGGKAAAA